MARAVKKVKKARKPRTKKFWITLGSIFGVLLVAAIGIILYFVLNKDEAYDYFSEIDEAHITYAEIQKKAQNSSYDHMFIFVYDDKFNPSDDTTHAEIEAEVIRLYGAVLDFNKNYEAEFEFYLVDTSVTRNSGILNNEVFGAVSSSNTLIYLYGGKSAIYPGNVDPDNAPEGAFTEEISGGSKQYIKQARDYVEYLKGIAE